MPEGRADDDPGPDLAAAEGPRDRAGDDHGENAGDDPEAYLAGDRRRALAEGRELPERVRGAALFADISGFTPLTEALADELGPQRGAEELTGVLETVFSAVLGVLHRYGGDVIYFSGDAVTCWLDGDDGRLATRCAIGMQAEMDRVGTIRTPAGRPIRLAMKVAVAAGPARRFVVGDPTVQLIDVLAGSLMDRLAATERAARSGEVVVDTAVLAAVGDALVHTGRTVDRTEVGVVHGLAVDVAPPPPAPEVAPLPEDLVRPWLLPPVYERMRAGRGEFLAELRPAIPLFLRFGGLDFDADDDAPGHLDTFIRRAQRVVDGYGGHTLQLTVGDKGAYLYAVFGSPIAHEDDAARACAAALDLLALEADAPVRDLQLGLAQGRLRSGTYGHRRRRTFCCLGDAVNLAARLMVAAPIGRAWVSGPVAAAAAGGFELRALPPLRVKGKAEPATVYELTARRATVGRRAGTSTLVGRAAELARLQEVLAPAYDRRQGRVVGVGGEAGVGKSRILGELAGHLAARGVRVAHGVAQAYGTSAGYAAWQPVWRTLFGLPVELPDPATVLSAVTDALPAELAPRAPLFALLLGVPLADNELTARFDAKLRKTSLETTAAQALAALAEAGPLLLVLEDAHRLDPLSRDLLVVLARAVTDLPVGIALAYRPGAAYGGNELAELGHASELTLGPLDPADTERAVRDRLRRLYGAAAAPSADLVAFVARRCEGNPLYVRELCAYLHDQGVDPAASGPPAVGDLPDSLHRLMLSRIDALAEGPRRTAKVASVVGRSFRAGLLAQVYPELGEVDPPLRELAAGDLVLPETPPEDGHSFSHAIVADVAYESVPFALRAQLHEAVAGCLEAGADGDPETQLDRLAHHYGRSTNVAKKHEYLFRAGVAAQAAYANDAALAHYAAALPLLPEDRRADVLLRIGKVRELTGAWVQAGRAYGEAMALAERLQQHDVGAWARTWAAEVARKQGRYEEAAAGLTDAGGRFAALADDAGAGQVLHLQGTLAAQRGDYPAATAAYRASLAIRERLGDLASQGALLSNLAIVEEYQGRYAAAQELNEQALELRRRDGDPWAIGVSQNNLGMIAVLREDFAAAQRHFAESMRLNRLVGDGWMVALGHNNLGNALRGLGDYTAAGREYAQALTTYRAQADQWALAILYEDVAQLAALRGLGPAATRLVAAADRARERIGSPRAPDVQAQLDRVLAGVGATIERAVADAVERADAESRTRLATALDAARDRLAARGLSPDLVPAVTLDPDAEVLAVCAADATGPDR